MIDLNTKTTFGPSGDIPILLDSLRNSYARASAIIDNRCELYQDAIVQLHIKTTSKGRIRHKHGAVHVYGCSHEAFKTGFPTTVLGSLSVTQKNTEYKRNLFVADAFCGMLPETWCIIVENKCGVDIEIIKAKYQGLDIAYLPSQRFDSSKPNEASKPGHAVGMDNYSAAHILGYPKEIASEAPDHYADGEAPDCK